MNFKYNKKYFTGSNLPVVIGVVLTIISLLVLIIFFNSWGFVMLFPAIVGVVLITFTLGGKSSDADLAEQIKKKSEFLPRTAAEKFGLLKLQADKFDRDSEKRWNMMPPFEFGGFEFSEGEKFVRKGGDGTMRSSTYTTGVYLFGLDRLYIYSKTFSLLEEKETEIKTEAFYNDLKAIEVRPHEFKYRSGSKELTHEYTRMHVIGNSGELFSTPVHNDAAVDDMIKELFRRIYAMDAAKKREQEQQ